jgi:hypothetical protein
MLGNFIGIFFRILVVNAFTDTAVGDETFKIEAIERAWKKNRKFRWRFRPTVYSVEAGLAVTTLTSEECAH